MREVLYISVQIYRFFYRGCGGGQTKARQQMTTTKSTAAHTHTFLEIFSKFESQKNNVRSSFDSSRRENSNLFLTQMTLFVKMGGRGEV